MLREWRVGYRIACIAGFILSIALLFLSGLASAQQFTASEETSPRTIIDIDPVTLVGSIPPIHETCNSGKFPVNTLYSTGFITGWTYVGEVLYMLDVGAPNYVLKTLEVNVAGCGIGSAVNPKSDTGYAAMVSLAYCPGFPDSGFSQNFIAHNGVMVKLNLSTGVGEQVGGTMATDLRITGMDCDEGGLWAVTSVFATRVSELYRIDPATGAASLIGATGIPAGEIESLAIDRTAPNVRLVGGKSSLYEIDPDTGAGSMEASGFMDLFAMTSTVPEPSPALLAATALGTLALTRRRERTFAS